MCERVNRSAYTGTTERPREDSFINVNLRNKTEVSKRRGVSVDITHIM